jgi:DNA polymerase-3 subunit beta
MKLTIDREALADVASRAMAVSDRHQIKPILASILLVVEPGCVVLTGTDLEAAVKTTIPISEDHAIATGTLTNKVLLSPRAVALLRNDSSETVMLGWGDTGLEIKTDITRFREGTVLPGDFPEVSGELESPTWKADVPSVALMTAIRRVSPAIGVAERRGAMDAICFDRDDSGRLAVVACDSRRFMRQEISADPPNYPVLVPGEWGRQIVATTRAAESVRVSADENAVLFQCGRTTLRLRLREGRYPCWRQLVPKAGRDAATVPCGTLLDRAKTMAAAAAERAPGLTPAIAFGIDKERIRLRLDGSATEAETEIPVASSATGQGLYDPAMLLPMLTALPPDATVGVSIEGRGMLAMATDDGWCGAIMGIDR